MKAVWVAISVLAAFAACGKSQDPALPGASGPMAVRIAAATRGFHADWRATWPLDWIDVRTEGHGHSWLYDGDWRVTGQGAQAVLEVPVALTHPREPLSFRRYRGAAFGPNGALPMRYRIQAEARSLGGSTRFGGYGEVAIQAFYLSPTTYVEVLQTDKHLMLWEARNAPPMQGKGWRRLASVPHRASVGEWVRFGAEVDRQAGTITALLDGRAVATGRSPLLVPEGPGAFTLRATGNREEWRSLEVREMH